MTNQEFTMKKTLLAFAISAASITAVSAQDLTISITNLTHGSHFTPLLVSAHPASSHLFEVGTAASANLQAMAEGGNTSGLITDLNGISADVTDNPVGDLMAPGQSVSFDMMTAMDNTNLSIVAMVLPTNDGFVGLDSMVIPTTPGTYTYFLNAYDAGTEVNDEIINGGGAPGAAGIPADPLGAGGMGATGVTNSENNETVHVHRGVIGDTDATGGKSDLDSRVHRWLNPVAKLVIEVK
jgi:hypothetical protein